MGKRVRLTYFHGLTAMRIMTAAIAVNDHRHENAPVPRPFIGHPQSDDEFERLMIRVQLDQFRPSIF